MKKKLDLTKLLHKELDQIKSTLVNAANSYDQGFACNASCNF